MLGMAVQRHLRVTGVDLGRLHTHGIQQGGNHVTDMVILVTDAASMTGAQRPLAIVSGGS